MLSLFTNQFIRGVFRLGFRGLHWWPQVSKLLILLFCFFHIGSIVWWLIPAKGFVKDSRFIEYPQPLRNIEENVIAFKRELKLPRPLWKLFEQYTFRTAMWQSWWMFAPNPIDVHLYLTSKAVLGWKEENEIPLKLRKKQVWGDSREPLYDEVPIYRSYSAASVEEARHTYAGWYTDDHKLAENFASGKWDRAIESFAQWSRRNYEEKTGIIAPGVHVILSTVRIPEPFTGIRPDEVPVNERVIWYLHELDEPTLTPVRPVRSNKK